MNYIKSLAIKEAIIVKLAELLAGTVYEDAFMGTYYSEGASFPMFSIGLSEKPIIGRSNGFLRYESVNNIRAYLSVKEMTLIISALAELDEEAKNMTETIRNQIVDNGEFTITVENKNINFLTVPMQIGEATRIKEGKVEGYQCNLQMSGLLKEIILEGLNQV